MGIDAIQKLLPPNSLVYSLEDFLFEYASVSKQQQQQWLDVEDSRNCGHARGQAIFSSWIVAPLPSCPVLNATKPPHSIQERQNWLSSPHNKYNHRCPTKKSSSSSDNNKKTNHYCQKQHQSTIVSRTIPSSSSSSSFLCHQSVTAIVDDVISSLVQQRERLMSRWNHKRKHPRKRSRSNKSLLQRKTCHHHQEEEDITNASTGANNVLIHGFGISQDDGYDPYCAASQQQQQQYGIGRALHGLGIVYQHNPNEAVAFLKLSPIVKDLHKLIGDDALRLILKHTRCFVPIGGDDNKNNFEGEISDNDCNYMLLCGPPLSYTARRHHLCNKNHHKNHNQNDKTTKPTLSRHKRRRRIFSKDQSNSVLDTDSVATICPHTAAPQSEHQLPTAPSSPRKRNKSSQLHQSKQELCSNNDHRRRHCRSRYFPSSIGRTSPLHANQSISRFSLLYCDSYIPKVGLPKSHPFSQRLLLLQQLREQKIKNRNDVTANNNDTSCSGSATTCEFLLNVVFDLHRENRNKQRRIKRRLLRTHKGGGKIVLNQLWKRYSTSSNNYERLLHRYCPLPQYYRKMVGVVHETVFPAKVTVDTDAAATAVANGCDNIDHRLAILATSCHSSKEEIVSFLCAFLKRVFPDAFWGSERNFQSFLQSIRSFVYLRKHEKLVNKNLMQGISIKSVKWLLHQPPPPPPKTKTKLKAVGTTAGFGGSENTKDDAVVAAPVDCPHRNRKPKKRKRQPGKQRTNHETATELTLQAFRWVIKGVVIPLLRSCFYVTETEFGARELSYYRKPVWALFRALSIQKVTNHRPKNNANNNNLRHFRTLTSSQAMEYLWKQQRNMGVSRLRFLPKATGMRPIAQLSSRSSQCFHFQSTQHCFKGQQAPSIFSGEAATTSKSMKSVESNDRDYSRRVRVERQFPFRPRKKQKVDLATSISISRPPTNIMLEKVLDVLTYECNRVHMPYGNGLENLNEFYIRYRNFVKRWKQQPKMMRSLRDNNSKSINGQPTRLYFAKVDIEKCYDRINQDYLLDIAQHLVTHNTYVCQTIKIDCANLTSPKVANEAGITTQANTNNTQRFKKLVEPIESYKSFYQRQHPLSFKHQNTVFELLRCSLVEKSRVLRLLKEHLLQHIVVTAGRHEPLLLLQSRGISQGSTLSMLLCNLYYGRLEKLMLGDKDCRGKAPKLIPRSEAATKPYENQTESHLIARFVDDFLFVSPHQYSFRHFLDNAHMGKPELGAKVNPNKTLVNTTSSVVIPGKEEGTQTINLLCSDRVMNNGRRLFPWCGLLFDTETGEVLVDYERFRGGKLAKSITIDFDGNEGEKLAERMKAFLFPRCLPILYDPSINSFPTIATNFYQMMLFGACKIAMYIVGLNTSKKSSSHKPHNAKYFCKCILELAGYAIKNIRSKSKSSGPESNNITQETDPRQVFGLDRKTASALSLKAHCDVFSYLSGFGAMSHHLLHESLAAMDSLPRKKRMELSKIMARAFDDFRINSMIKKQCGMYKSLQ